MPGWNELHREIASCEQCPRLRSWCAEVALARRKAFAHETYWGRPVPSFGDRDARVLLVGLAPAAHGANRTGRMFTGDRSGDFLFAALHAAGFASSPLSRSRGDGLELHGLYLTAAARCAPPANKPTPEEFALCRGYLDRELDLLPQVRVLMSLGRLAHEQLSAVLVARGWIERRADVPFAHGCEYPLPGGRHLMGSFHPSQQNTFTGKLTPAMMTAVLTRARQLAELPRHARL